MSKAESGTSRMSGSRTNEGLKGSDVGTRSQDENGEHPATARSNHELRRRMFFDHTIRSRRPTLHRRNAASSIPRTSVTTIVETIVRVPQKKRQEENDGSLPFPLASAATSSLIPEILTPPAVPEFPTLSNPTVPTVPAYPFNTLSSQSVLLPPPSPAPSDTSFSPTPSFPSDASPTDSPSEESSPSSNGTTESSETITSPTAASTFTVSYFNTTLATSTRSDSTSGTGSISSSGESAFSTRTSDSSPQSTGDNPVNGAAATLSATGTGPAPIATSGSGAGSDTGSSGPIGPNTPQVVGGVVGGIAGLAVVLLVILFFLRRYRKQLQDRGQLLDPDNSGRDASNPMIMRSSHTPLVAAVAASFRRMRPGSSHTTATGETSTSDRGFQRVAGRKIEPVLVTGGDGYGGSYGAFEKDTAINKETGAPSSSHPESQPLAGTSFYRDNGDYYAGAHGSGSSTPTATQTRFASDNRDFADDDYNRAPSPGPDVIAVMRPSPARSPITTSSSPNQLAPQRPGPSMASDAPPTPTLPSRFIPDGVGRSLISQDGSRGSRFTESV